MRTGAATTGGGTRPGLTRGTPEQVSAGGGEEKHRISGEECEEGPTFKDSGGHGPEPGEQRAQAFCLLTAHLG